MNFNPHPGETLHNCKPLKHINRHIATLTFFSFSILTFVQGFYIYQKKKWQSSYSVEFVTLRRQGRSSKLRNGFSCSMSGHTALCDVGDSISDSKVSIMSVVTLYHERDLSQEPQSNDPLSYLSRHRTMLSHGRMLAYWMNIKTWREACQGPSAMFKSLLGSSGHMSPTIYLNSVSHMMPVLVCSAGSPRV